MVWEATAQVVKDGEAIRKQLCDDQNQLVQESANTQITRLEELKSRLENLNPSRISSDAPINATTSPPAIDHQPSVQTPLEPENARSPSNNSSEAASDGHHRPAEVREKKRMLNLARGKGNKIILPKSRGSTGPGWTGAGFDVDGRS